MPATATAVLGEASATCLVVEGPVSAGWLAERLASGEAERDAVCIVACVREPRFDGAGELEASALAAEWREEQNALVRAAQSSGRPLLVVRYEELQAQPEETLTRVCEFAAVGYEPALRDGWTESATTTGGIFGVPGVAEADRHKTAEWVQETLHGTRDAVLDDRADAAIRTLRMITDHFGPAFDDLGLGLTYESLVIVLLDLLNTNQPRGTEALARARALVEASPRNVEARRLLAVANANTGHVQRTLEAYGELVRLSGETNAPLEQLPRNVLALLSAIDPAEPALPAFFRALAGYPKLAAVLDVALAERLRGGDRAESVQASLRELRAVRGMPFHPDSPPDFMHKRMRLLPSIWLGRFETHSDWLAHAPQLDSFGGVMSAIDERVLQSHHTCAAKAWCAVCAAEMPMDVSWMHASVTDTGSVVPAWTETNFCPGCGLNSRMRAVYALVTEELRMPPTARVYAAEQITRGFVAYRARFPNLVGSEYLGSQHRPGEMVMRDDVLVRHEDHTKLSFATGSFDLVIAQDVFEHIPDYRAAFRESRRVLAADGCLAFSVPFFSGQYKTEVRARVAPDGTLEHLLPEEWHGNPLGGGSLCFQHFGWDILDQLRAAGFSRAAAHLYWGPWQGHSGLPLFVFSAKV
jgi:SAM-dependent methyltransferase